MCVDIQRNLTGLIYPDVYLRENFYGPSIHVDGPCIHVVNQNNIRTIMKEVLNFLDVAEPEFKAYIATNALVAAEKHSSK